MAYGGTDLMPLSKVSAAERQGSVARRAAGPVVMVEALVGNRGEQDAALWLWKLRHKGVALPPLEVGHPEMCMKYPQQPHPQNRATLTVGPEQGDRADIPKASKEDIPPYPSQGWPADTSIRHGAIALVFPYLQARSFQMHQHDRRALVTASPSGVPPSQLAGMVAMGVLSRGQEYNAFDQDAKTKSPELSIDVTGIFAMVNRSGMRIPAGTPLAAVLPRRIVPTGKDAENYYSGNLSKIPGPAVKHTENEKNLFEAELAPVPLNIAQRLSDVLYVSEFRPMRAGFMDKPYNKTNYNPLGCLEALRGVVHADLDHSRTSALLESEGVDAQLTYRMLSIAFGLIEHGLPGIGAGAAAGAAAPAGAMDEKGVPLNFDAWGREAERLVGMAAARTITLSAFVEAKKGDAGMAFNGAKELLRQFKNLLPEGNYGLAETGELPPVVLRTAVGGVDASQALFNACANQMYQQVVGSVIGVSITPSSHGSEIEWLKA